MSFYIIWLSNGFSENLSIRFSENRDTLTSVDNTLKIQVNVIRVQNRKLKEQVSIQDTQIQALQDSLREIEDQATRQKETSKKLSELEIERDDLKELVSKLSEQLGNLSAEQNTFNSRNSTPC